MVKNGPKCPFMELIGYRCSKYDNKNMFWRHTKVLLAIGFGQSSGLNGLRTACKLYMRERILSKCFVWFEKYNILHSTGYRGEQTVYQHSFNL